jgi:YD repeat-containing protein
MAAIWLLLLGLLAPALRASELAFTYDDAGRLTAARFDAATNLVFGYDHSGSLRREASYFSASPEAALTQSVLPAEPAAGIPFYLRVTAVNLSPGASGLRMTAEIPAGLNVVEAVSSSGSVQIAGGLVHSETAGSPARALELLITLQAPVAGTFVVNSSLASAPDALAENNSTSTRFTVLPGPALAISAAGALSWPATAGTSLLEETDDLSPPVVWRASEAFGLFGGAYRASAPAASGNRFYRLRLLAE